MRTMKSITIGILFLTFTSCGDVENIECYDLYETTYNPYKVKKSTICYETE